MVNLRDDRRLYAQFLILFARLGDVREQDDIPLGRTAFTRDEFAPHEGEPRRLNLLLPRLVADRRLTQINMAKQLVKDAPPLE